MSRMKGFVGVFGRAQGNRVEGEWEGCETCNLLVVVLMLRVVRSDVEDADRLSSKNQARDATTYNPNPH